MYFFFAPKPLRIWGQNATPLFSITFQNNGMTGMLNVSVSVENTSCFKNWELSALYILIINILHLESEI
jgi:hypothetical protein